MSRFWLGGVLLGGVLLLAVVWWRWDSAAGRGADVATQHEGWCDVGSYDVGRNSERGCQRGDWLAVAGADAPRYCDFTRQFVVVGSGLLCQYVGYVRVERLREFLGRTGGPQK